MILLIQSKIIYLGLLILAPIFIFAKYSLAATYYIDPGCAYNGNGTSTSCAVSPGATGAYNSWEISYSCGNRYLGKKGTTWQADPANANGALSIGNQNCAANVMEISSYGSGAKPILTSVASLPGWASAENWTNHSGNAWYISTSGWAHAFKDPVRVWLSGTLYAESDNTVSNFDVSDITFTHRWYYSSQESRIYLYAEENPAIAYTSIEGLQGSDSTIYIENSSYIDIHGLDIRHAHTATMEAHNVDYVNFYDNTLRGRLKISETGNSDSTNWTIFNNHFDGDYHAPIVYDNQDMKDLLTLDCSSYNVVRNNKFEEATHDGVYITCDNKNVANGSSYNQVYENYFTWEDVAGLNYYGRCFGIDGMPHTSGGMSMENVFTRNYCKDAHSRSQPNGYNNEISYNIFDTVIKNETQVHGNSSAGGISMKAYAPYNESAGNKIVNNVFYNTVDPAIYISDVSVYDHTIKNNIFLNPGNDASNAIMDDVAIYIIEGGGDTSRILIENNIYYADGAKRFIYNDGYLDVNNASFIDCNDCTNTGNMNVNPHLTNVTRGDFSLLEDSPAINAGINPGTSRGRALLPGSIWPTRVIAVDPNKYGAKPEIGAYAYPEK